MQKEISILKECLDKEQFSKTLLEKELKAINYYLKNYLLIIYLFSIYLFLPGSSSNRNITKPQQIAASKG